MNDFNAAVVKTFLAIMSPKGIISAKTAKAVAPSKDGSEKVILITKKIKQKVVTPKSVEEKFDSAPVEIDKCYDPKQSFESYRALGGKTPLFALINPDTRAIYEDVTENELPNPADLESDDLVKSSEEDFLNAVDLYFGHYSALDVLNILSKTKLTRVTEDAIAAYVKRYRSTIRRLDKDEILTEETIGKYFLKGIEHQAFKTRMEAALQKEKRSLANLTKVVFSQLQI
ncbi:hypothetical protein ADUPG1_000608, partial [Aduncisulcus paluster]